MAKEEQAAEFKYTLEEVEKETGLKPASIRAALRTSDFKRSGSSWGWNTKAEFEQVLKYFKDRTGRRPDMKAKEADKKAAAKPSKKAVAPTPEKPAKKAKAKAAA